MEIKKSFLKTYILLKKNKLKVAIASISEILFLFIFLSIFSTLSVKIMEVESKVKGVMGASNMKDLVANEALILQSYSLLIRYFLFILLALFICWLVFQLVSWLFVHKIVHKINWKQFILRFLAYTTVFFALGSFLAWILFKLSDYSSLAILNLLTPGVVSALFRFILLTILYLMFISYSKFDVKLKQMLKSSNVRS